MSDINRISPLLILLFFLVYGISACSDAPSEDEISLSEPILLSDNGGWCWFQGPRIVTDGEYVLIGSVAIGDEGDERRGNVDAIVYHPESGEMFTSTLSENLQANDHATPGFLLRPDGRWLAVYTRHGNDNFLLYRISEPGDPSQWSEEQQYIPSEETRITYTNLYMMEEEDGRIYNFFRGLDNSWKPSFVYSDDLGESWQTGNIFIEVPTEERHRPYVIYTDNGHDTIHMSYTEGHPRNYNNSIYHIYYRDGMLHQSDGAEITSLEEGLEMPEEGTLVYEGSADSVHWTTDLVLDDDEFPRMVFSTKRNDTELGQVEDGNDQRYHYARWDGGQWHVHEIAYAGTSLYPGEYEYTGLAAIDPRNPDVVYISADADPVTNEPLISEATGNRQYELFRGETTDGGETWQWNAITENSSADNLRPVAVQLSDNQTFLAWLHGEYRTYTDYTQEVLGLVVSHK